MSKRSQKEELERIQGRLNKVKNRRGTSFDDETPPEPAPPAQSMDSSFRGEGRGGAWESISLSSPKARKKGLVTPTGAIRKGSAAPGSTRMLWQGSPKPNPKKDPSAAPQRSSGFKKAPSTRRIVGEDQRFNLMNTDSEIISPQFSPHSSKSKQGSIAGIFRSDLGARATGMAPPFVDEFNDAAANADSEEYLDSDKNRNRLNPMLAGVAAFFTDSYSAAKYQADRIYLSMLRRRGTTDPKQLCFGIVFVVIVAGIVLGILGLAGNAGTSALRAQEIQKILVEAEVTSQEAFDDKSSPQHQALHWIAKEDPARLSTDHAGLFDRYILAVFYFSSNAERWVRSDSWMTATGHCSWYGIQCVAHDDESQESGVSKTYDGTDYITEIVLVDNGLEGAIPAEFAKLSSMMTLDLSENELSGDIPVFHDNLRNLLLRKNSFGGSIPTTITQMSNLHGIDLSTNRFSGKVPTKLGDLTELRYLLLSENQLSGEFPEIKKMYSITKLHLDDNSFSGSIPTFLREFGRLGKYTPRSCKQMVGKYISSSSLSY